MSRRKGSTIKGSTIKVQRKLDKGELLSHYANEAVAIVERERQRRREAEADAIRMREMESIVKLIESGANVDVTEVVTEERDAPILAGGVTYWQLGAIAVVFNETVVDEACKPFDALSFWLFIKGNKPITVRKTTGLNNLCLAMRCLEREGIVTTRWQKYLQGHKLVKTVSGRVVGWSKQGRRQNEIEQRLVGVDGRIEYPTNAKQEERNIMFTIHYIKNKNQEPSAPV